MTVRVNSSSSSAGAVWSPERRSKITQHGADGPFWSTAGRRRACECKAELSLGISSDGGWQPRQLPPLLTSLLLSVPSLCRTPQLCLCPSHHTKKYFYPGSLLWSVTAQLHKHSAGTACQSELGRNKREDGRLWQQQQKLLSWSSSPGVSFTSFTSAYRLPRWREYACDCSEHKVFLFLFLASVLH